MNRFVFLFVAFAVASVGLAKEKFPESCDPAGVVESIAVGSEGTVHFRLSSKRGGIFTISPNEAQRNQNFLSLLLASNQSKKRVCLLVENGQIIAVNYDVKRRKGQTVKSKSRRNTQNASMGFEF